MHIQVPLFDKAIVSTKGQIVIPKSLRKAFGIHAGTELIFEAKQDYFSVKPKQRKIEMFFGCCKVSASSQPIDIDEAIMKAVLDNDKKTEKQS